MKTITPQVRRAAPGPPPGTRPADPASSVDLRIDAVVFHGFSRAAAHRAAIALQQELVRLVTTQGFPPDAPASSARLDAGTIPANADRPELTGARAARAIHGGLRA